MRRPQPRRPRKSRMSRREHVPQRTCVGCRAVGGQSALIGIRADAAGMPLVESRRGPGRHAYLCPRLECFNRAWERRALLRALRCDAAGVDRAAVQQEFEAAVRRRTMVG